MVEGGTKTARPKPAAAGEKAEVTRLPYLNLTHLEAENAVERGQVDVLVLVERGVLLSVHQATRVALRRLGEIGVRSEDVRVDVVSDHVLWYTESQPGMVYGLGGGGRVQKGVTQSSARVLDVKYWGPTTWLKNGAH